MPNRLTMKDIAVKAGVARQTVSEVLSNASYSRVSKSTREKVLSVAQELKYQPNHMAQALRTGKTNCIGILRSYYMTNAGDHYYPPIADGVEKWLAENENRYSFMMFGSNFDSTYRKSMALLEQKLVDGLIVVALSQRIPYSSQLENAVKPVIYEAISDSKSLSHVPAGTEDRLGEMVTIAAGSFLMGNTGDEGFEGPEEFPQHPVYLPTYQIGKYEVTRGQYRRFIEAGGYEDPDYWSPEGWKWKQSDVIVYAGMHGKFRQVARPNRSEPRREPEHWAAEQEWIGHGFNHPRFIQTDDHPVVGVTYYEAEAYCTWAGGRLPTEAEWEKAARWDEKSQHANIWPWGDTWDPEKCNNPEDRNPVAGGYRTNQSAPVGSYPEGASPYGCMDMVGNAYEWVADVARSYPGNPSPFVHEGSHFVRGGCWDDGPLNVRCAYRGWYLPASSAGVGPGDSDYMGFRVAR